MIKFFRDLVTELLQPSNHLTNCCRLHQAFPATVLFAVAGRAVVVSGVAELDVVVHELPSVGCFKAFIDNHLVHSEHFAICFGTCNQEVLFNGNPELLEACHLLYAHANRRARKFTGLKYLPSKNGPHNVY